MTAVSSPVAGTVLPLSAVPDPVFAAEMVGAGVAISPAIPRRPGPVGSPAVPGSPAVLSPSSSPDDDATPSVIPSRSVALAPVSGRLMKGFPHAFVIQGDAMDVLVHLGLDTVSLKGEGFTLLAEEGSEVACGDPVVEWDPAAVEVTGLSPLVLVCVLGTPPGSVFPGPEGRQVEAGSLLFVLPQL